MKIAIIYTGQERTWQDCKANHHLNLWCEDAGIYFHTVERLSPGDYYQLTDHPYNENKEPETIIASTLNQWHNNFIGFSIVPKDYDVYVRVRPDIMLTDKINFEQYDYSGKNIYIPSGHNYRDGINDQLAFGNYEVMKTYYSVYLNHPEMFTSGLKFHTEKYTTENLKRNGIIINRINIETQIVRLHG